MGYRYRRNNWEGGVQETRPAGSGQVHSQQTYTCCHCGMVVVIPFKAKPDTLGSFCMLCHKPTCAKVKCNAVNGCVPLERRLEQMEARAKLLAAVG